jgi:hypothetical protein
MKPFLTAFALAAGLSALGAQAAKAESVTVTGEFIDTWCYISQVMGPSDFTRGTAHHKCAVWCAAGGIPVGLIDDEGQIFFVLKVEDEEGMGYPGTAVLEEQSHVVTVDGELIERDGLKYLLIGEVRDDQGVVRTTHEQVGIVPPFAAPK